MSSVPAIDPTSSASPADVSDDAKVQQAFQQGILTFMISVLQGAESDVISAINDTTSDPDGA
jgi:hypothetical protein